MGDSDSIDQYEQHYQEIKQLLQESKALPDLFCQLTTQLRTLPEDVHSQMIQTQVQTLFVDLNKQIEKYNEQFRILLDELGVLCRQGQAEETLVQQFFQGLLDFFRLAFTMYHNNPEKLAPFAFLLDQFHQALVTRKWKLEGETLQKALLLQLTKSAWALTRSNQDILSYTKTVKQQLGGQRKTRKQHRSKH